MSDTQGEWRREEFRLRPGMHLHLIGIGGAGISAIARVLVGRGYVVSGSDKISNDLTAALEASGVAVFEGHRPENIGEAEALIISSAVPASNPEVEAAVAKGIPVFKRADILGQLMEGTIGIAVAGTHGKTTTSGLIADILIAAGRDPTVIVGGVLPSIGANGRHGEGDTFVIEADEYDHMFLGLRPQLIVILNLEHDHPDMFPTMQAYAAAFREFVALLPASGRLITCVDDAGVRNLLTELDLSPTSLITYGLSKEDGRQPGADFEALDYRPNQLGGMDFLVQKQGTTLGLARLRIPGLHNVQNALAAIAVAIELEVDFHVIRKALAEFGGVGRRFQVVGEVGGVVFIDDYAHHPTEIKATLAAARQRYPGRRLWAIWQPHTYSRTKVLLDQFATSFNDADRLVALEIFRSREQNSMGVDTSLVLGQMDHPHAVHMRTHADAATYVLDRLRPDDVVLTLSAGDGNVVGNQVMAGVKQRIGKE